MNLLNKTDVGVYFIAEMSANHAGSLDNALAIIKSAKDSGADCLKIQTYTPDTMTLNCDSDLFKIKGGLWDGYSLYELYKKAYTPWEWHVPIKRECERLGLDFLSTPFDKTAVDFLEELGVGFYKIASFELTDIPLIEYTASKRKPMIISCGMGSETEIGEAVAACGRQGNSQVFLLKCTSEYPANYANMNLSVIADMRDKFGVKVGLSDHSVADGGSLAPIVAASLGACVIEKHFCLSRGLGNPDSEFSSEPHEFREMVRLVNKAVEIRGRVDYSLSDSEKSSTVFRRSVFAVRGIAKGEDFSEANIRVIRPSHGLKPKHYNELLNKTSKKSYEYGEPINENEIF